MADAGALRVDVRLGGPHGDLRAVPGFAREGDDLDRSVDDFGDLQLEEAADEVGVGAREAHGGPPRADRDVQDEGADAVAVAETLGRHLLLGAQDRLVLPDVDEDVAAVAAGVVLNRARHHFPLLALEGAEDPVGFGVAQPLRDDRAVAMRPKSPGVSSNSPIISPFSSTSGA